MGTLNVQIAAQPIIWSNDDFHDLGGETSLETCLGEMREAGYAGTELGHKFPKDATVLKSILSKFGLQLVSGWHSSYLAEAPLPQERESFRQHLSFLKQMGSPVVIVAECTRRNYNDPYNNLSWSHSVDFFSKDEWERIFAGMDEFAQMAEDQGMSLVYHHHMGTGIQNLGQIDRLMSGTRKLQLLGDTGHLAFAGEDPLAVFKTYMSRIRHVHLKNVRPQVVDQARKEKWSFERAVFQGVFTVPGDAGIDYRPIFELLRASDYKGWLVVEAEQDPKKANPFQYATMARNYLRQELGV